LIESSSGELKQRHAAKRRPFVTILMLVCLATISSSTNKSMKKVYHVFIFLSGSPETDANATFQRSHWDVNTTQRSAKL
jgi:hypothetical protein